MISTNKRILLLVSIAGLAQFSLLLLGCTVRVEPRSGDADANNRLDAAQNDADDRDGGDEGDDADAASGDADAASGGSASRYGPVTAGWGLANTAIQGELEWSQTFRPTTTSGLVAFRGYLEDDDGGYGAGTGGTIHFEIQTDGADGFASGDQVGSGYVDVVHPKASGLTFAKHEFTEPVPVEAGTLYHLYAKNVDPSPSSNFVSMNAIYFGTGPNAELSCNKRYGGGDWRQRGEDGMTYLPIAEFYYEDGTVDGVGFIHAMPHSEHVHEFGGGAAIRERFTVSGGDRSVSHLHLYVRRVSGSAPLVATLRSGGTAVAEAESASESAVDSRGGQWFEFPLDLVLSNGQSYDLELTAAAGAIAESGVLRAGTSYGFSPASEFGDGHAQYSDDGEDWENWRIWGSSSTQGDLMFYFDP